jgi:PadR family transcriptional regulator PadR
MPTVRMTYAAAAVLQALDQGYRYGFDIADATRLRGGTVYPILRRLADAGMIRGHWENARISRHEGRPARKYYRLTLASQEMLATARARYPLPWLEAGATSARETV